MGRAQVIQNQGNAQISSDEGGLAPGQPTILRVWDQDAAPDANGIPQKRTFVRLAPPDPIGTYNGSNIWLDAPDSAGTQNVTAGETPMDGTSPLGGSFRPMDIGFYAYDPAVTQFDFLVPAAKFRERRRLYVVPNSERRHAKPIQYGQPGASVSKQFVSLEPSDIHAGREVAPLVSDVELIPAAEIPEAYGGPWESNPLQQTTEGGQQVLRFALRYVRPEDDQNYQAYGGENIVIDDGATQYWPGNIAKGNPPIYISEPLPLRPGETEYTVYVISYSTAAINNQLVIGITPSVSFSFTRTLGPEGLEYTRMVSADGIHAFVVSSTVAGSDGTALRRFYGYWENLDRDDVGYDPTLKGIEMVAEKPDGSLVILGGGVTSPIQVDVSDPIAVESWRVWLRSVDVNGRHNSLQRHGHTVWEAGDTPFVTISVGNPNGQLNLAKARSDTFSLQFEISAGAFRVKELDADVIRTGRLQIGGGLNMASQLKLFDSLGSLYGYWGEDASYSGLWTKTARLGGSGPTSSAADQIRISGGVISIGSSITLVASQILAGYPTSFLTGLITNGQLDTNIALAKLASGTLPGSVALLASSILAGTISVALTLTSPNIVSTSGVNQVTINGGQITVVQSSLGWHTDILANGFSIYVASTGAGIAMDPTSGFSLFGSGGFTLTSIHPSTGIKNLTSGGTEKVRIHNDGTNGYVQFNAGSHYALWTNAIGKKFRGGATTLSSGAANISTGLSSIDSGGGNIVWGGGAASGEVLDVGASGGTLTLVSSNAASTRSVTWWALGS